MFIDLDHFKPVNDTYGHAVGDEVLRTVAARQHASIRTGGDDDRSDMVCRLGGDEFVVLLHDVDEAGARRVAEHLLAAVREPIPVGDARIVVSATLGVALSRPGAGHPDVAVRAADAAMCQAKADGRGACRLALA